MQDAKKILSNSWEVVKTFLDKSIHMGGLASSNLTETVELANSIQVIEMTIAQSVATKKEE